MSTSQLSFKNAHKKKQFRNIFMLCKKRRSINQVFFASEIVSRDCLSKKQRHIRQIWWDFFIFHKFDEISFHQCSRVVLIKLDESLSSSLMSRSQFDEMRLFESFLSRSQMINRFQFDKMRSSKSSHQKHIRRSTNRERTHVAWYIENKYTSFDVSRMNMRHSLNRD